MPVGVVSEGGGSVNLKDSDDRARILELVDRCDVLLEGFRPGLAERLGIAPDEWRTRPATTSTTSRSPSPLLPTIGRTGERSAPPPNVVGITVAV